MSHDDPSTSTLIRSFTALSDMHKRLASYPCGTLLEVLVQQLALIYAASTPSNPLSSVPAVSDTPTDERYQLVYALLSLARFRGTSPACSADLDEGLAAEMTDCALFAAMARHGAGIEERATAYTEALQRRDREYVSQSCGHPVDPPAQTPPASTPLIPATAPRPPHLNPPGAWITSSPGSVPEDGPPLDVSEADEFDTVQSLLEFPPPLLIDLAGVWQGFNTRDAGDNVGGTGEGDSENGSR